MTTVSLAVNLIAVNWAALALVSLFNMEFVDIDLIAVDQATVGLVVSFDMGQVPVD